MSFACIHSRALVGFQSMRVRVEVHLANGLPSFTLVGLVDTEVREARERVRCAIQNSGLNFPANKRITVNLAPADLPKDSGRFDLPMALGILAASGQLPLAEAEKYEYAGELSLSGNLRPIRGALAMAFAIAREAAQPQRPLILPTGSASEAALVEGLTVLEAPHLLAVCAHLLPDSGEAPLARVRPAPPASEEPMPDMRDVRGQGQARRALEICAAGQHSLLMAGPPGAGKSMLAQRLPGLLPPMGEDQALASAAMRSLSGLGFSLSDWKRRPFRAPHHSASAVALVGGGSHPRPGEISLAHEGVLFLDELPEFNRKVLETLREPLESGHITISRAAQQVRYECAFQLVAAMNPFDAIGTDLAALMTIAIGGVYAIKGFTGIRVIDMTHNQAGPACAQILGFFGAEVIKLEDLVIDVAGYEVRLRGRKARLERKRMMDHFHQRQQSILRDLEAKVKEHGFEVIQADLSSQAGVDAVPSLLATPMPDGAVRCGVCAHRCLIRPGRMGICGVRERIQRYSLLGSLTATSW